MKLKTNTCVYHHKLAVHIIKFHQNGISRDELLPSNQFKIGIVIHIFGASYFVGFFSVMHGLHLGEEALPIRS